ncbi:hypothetical protein BCV70DRAFT_2743 [Testicularia cyperi]|uniref:Uncharacterized protein n=1 Tax=Testicularia cyperi TaxID=1882483 RepID=A0A317XW95_9BASI|nr:hypothetical protein BCV70DRAFT_2743 [Testicularia cyperi]
MSKYLGAPWSDGQDFSNTGRERLSFGTLPHPLRTHSSRSGSGKHDRAAKALPKSTTALISALGIDHHEPPERLESSSGSRMSDSSARAKLSAASDDLNSSDEHLEELQRSWPDPYNPALRLRRTPIRTSAETHSSPLLPAHSLASDFTRSSSASRPQILSGLPSAYDHHRKFQAQPEVPAQPIAWPKVMNFDSVQSNSSIPAALRLRYSPSFSLGTPLNTSVEPALQTGDSLRFRSFSRSRASSSNDSYGGSGRSSADHGSTSYDLSRFGSATGHSPGRSGHSAQTSVTSLGSLAMRMDHGPAAASTYGTPPSKYGSRAKHVDGSPLRIRTSSETSTVENFSTWAASVFGPSQAPPLSPIASINRESSYTGSLSASLNQARPAGVTVLDHSIKSNEPHFSTFEAMEYLEPYSGCEAIFLPRPRLRAHSISSSRAARDSDNVHEKNRESRGKRGVSEARIAAQQMPADQSGLTSPLTPPEADVFAPPRKMPTGFVVTPPSPSEADHQSQPNEQDMLRDLDPWIAVDQGRELERERQIWRQEYHASFGAHSSLRRGLSQKARSHSALQSLFVADEGNARLRTKNSAGFLSCLSLPDTEAPTQRGTEEEKLRKGPSLRNARSSPNLRQSSVRYRHGPSASSSDAMCSSLGWCTPPTRNRGLWPCDAKHASSEIGSSHADPSLTNRRERAVQTQIGGVAQVKDTKALGRALSESRTLVTEEPVVIGKKKVDNAALPKRPKSPGTTQAIGIALSPTRTDFARSSEESVMRAPLQAYKVASNTEETRAQLGSAWTLYAQAGKRASVTLQRSSTSADSAIGSVERVAPFISRPDQLQVLSDVHPGSPTPDSPSLPVPLRARRSPAIRAGGLETADIGSTSTGASRLHGLWGFRHEEELPRAMTGSDMFTSVYRGRSMSEHSSRSQTSEAALESSANSLGASEIRFGATQHAYSQEESSCSSSEALHSVEDDSPNRSAENDSRSRNHRSVEPTVNIGQTPARQLMPTVNLREVTSDDEVPKKSSSWGSSLDGSLGSTDTASATEIWNANNVNLDELFFRPPPQY